MTFDDGYLDHYTNVFPLLFERGWQGSFFPPSQTVLDGKLLDVNKIHFILAADRVLRTLFVRSRSALDAHSADPDVRPFEAYWNELAKPNRYDPAEVVFIKRALQFGLPESVRARWLIGCFTASSRTTQRRLRLNSMYRSISSAPWQGAACMLAATVPVIAGWIGCSPAQQAAEIDDSLRFSSAR